MSSVDYIYNYNKGRFGLSNNQLKLIGIVSMLIDHIGYMIIYNGYLFGYRQDLYLNAIATEEGKSLLIIYRICRIIGRIAFPIFAFCIVEGFIRTKNLFKYLFRLLVLAIISEIPYNLITMNKIQIIYLNIDFSRPPFVFGIELHNVIWTYFIGLLMLMLIKISEDKKVLQVIYILFACLITNFLKTDYSYFGILLIAMFYYTKYDNRMRLIFNSILSCIMTIENNFGAGILSTIFIFFYNGRRGNIKISSLFYIFYPLHMLILYMIVGFMYSR